MSRIVTLTTLALACGIAVSGWAQTQPTSPRGWATRIQRTKVATPSGNESKVITYYTNEIGMKFVLIPAGEFMMGSPDGEIGHGRDEGPQHKVRITNSFYMGACEVTRGQYIAVTGVHVPPHHLLDDKSGKPPKAGDPAYLKIRNYPAEGITWYDAVQFCNKLSKKKGVQYRLPTEAEWEYACRAGSTTPFYFGQTISTEQVNYDGKAYGSGSKGQDRNKSTPVGSFLPNAFGLFDMHGNVREWCQDYHSDNYYGKSPTDDPKGPDSGGWRVLRGGCWHEGPENMRSACRGRLEPDKGTSGGYGFRVVAVPE